MSIDGSGNVNVFFSSPRVSFGEPPNHTHSRSILPCTTSSLLTFADMVLALDNKHVLEADAIEPSCGYLGKGGSDHTYASNGYIRTTRSQTAKAAAQLEHQMAHEEEMPDKTKNEKYDAFLRKPLKYSSNSDANQSDNNELMLKTKRCSSVENLNSTVTKNSIKIEVESANAVSRTCEWPNAFLNKNSPRKSSSFEEVSFDTNKSSIKISKSTESVQRASASFTLHRLVNDTLEFPCWPRKADHTYATATWDGTAASHCLFEQEMSKDNISEDHEMEVVDHNYVSQQLNHSRESPISEQSQSMHNVFLQKEDHTYVKPKNISCSPEASEIVSTQEIIERPYFSSATFPRQKMRDDHTYFQSGLSRKTCGSDGTRDWSSAQNVADMVTSEDKYIEEAYKSLQSSTQSSYAKKDHNYSTST